jgi:hypothetical protein
MRYDTTVSKPVYLIDPGIYPATVNKAEEKTTRAGDPMMFIELEVFLPSGKSKFVKDYIVTGGEYPSDWKLKSLAVAVGLEVNGEIMAQDLMGKSMNAKIGKKPAKGDFPESNDVKDYYKPKSDDAGEPPIGREEAHRPAPARARPVAPAAGGDEEIPF